MNNNDDDYDSNDVSVDNDDDHDDTCLSIRMLPYLHIFFSVAL